MAPLGAIGFRMRRISEAPTYWLHPCRLEPSIAAGCRKAGPGSRPFSPELVAPGAPVLRNTIYPILLAFQSVPKVAIAPLLALWIGFGMLPKVVVVFLVCFFPIIVATATGFRQCRRRSWS